LSASHQHRPSYRRRRGSTSPNRTCLAQRILDQPASQKLTASGPLGPRQPAYQPVPPPGDNVRPIRRPHARAYAMFNSLSQPASCSNQAESTHRKPDTVDLGLSTRTTHPTITNDTSPHFAEAWPVGSVTLSADERVGPVASSFKTRSFTTFRFREATAARELAAWSRWLGRTANSRIFRKRCAWPQVLRPRLVIPRRGDVRGAKHGVLEVGAVHARSRGLRRRTVRTRSRSRAARLSKWQSYGTSRPGCASPTSISSASASASKTVEMTQQRNVQGTDAARRSIAWQRIPAPALGALTQAASLDSLRETAATRSAHTATAVRGYRSPRRTFPPAFECRRMRGDARTAREHLGL
jgi:hypothetical protein